MRRVKVMQPRVSVADVGTAEVQPSRKVGISYDESKKSDF